MQTPQTHELYHHALAQGLMLLDQNQQAQIAPLTLQPSIFARAAFLEALALAPILNRLLHQLAQDHDFLTAVLTTQHSDEFTRQLGALYQQVYQEGIAQPLWLGLFRADYFMHIDPKQPHQTALRQVEWNTIAVAFAALGSAVSRWHQWLTRLPHTALPDNPALQGFVEALILAWQQYGVDNAVICIVQQPQERNCFDQYALELALWQQAGIRVVYKTLLQIYTETHLQQNRLKITASGDEIAVVYYRAGYTPADYPSADAWAARLRLERANAIKAPPIQYQLCGLKTIQAWLAQTPALLNTYLPDPIEHQRLQACFAQFYDLRSATVRQHAEQHPEAFVLKPQREGGGHNYYGTAIPEQLRRLTPEQYPAWVLMARLHPPITANRFLTPSHYDTADQAVVSELGIFAACLAQQDHLLLNRACGHLLRTKPATTTEGGVAAGFAVLDSPRLADHLPIGSNLS